MEYFRLLDSRANPHRLAPLPIRLSVIVTTSAQWTTRFEMGKGGDRMEWLRAEMAA
jgi:hypothetical protein